MAINFLNKVDFNQNEIDKARLVNEVNDTAAGTPVDGQLYYNTTDNVVKVGEGGAWVSISGDITALTQGTYINIDTPAGPIPTINHDLTSRTDTTSASSPGSAGTFTTVDSVTTNSTGHVSALNLKTITLPTSDNYVSWTLDGDTGTPQTILSGDTATFTGGTGINTTVALNPDTLTIDIANTAVTAGSYTNASLTVDAQGRLTAASSGTAPLTNITAGDGLIETGAATTPTISVDYVGSDNFIALRAVGTPATSDQILFNDISDNNTVKKISISSLPLDNYSGWVIQGDSGQASINSAEILDISGASGSKAGIDTSVATGNPNQMTVSLDLNEITTVTTMASSEFLVGVNSSGANEKITIANLHLNQFGDAEADVDLGNNKLLDVKTGTAGTDGVNLAQVQAIAAGVGIFQGGYNAITNSPALFGGSNVALDQGDYYAVTDSNNTSFLGTVVEVGDLIFANNAIAANSTPSASDYTIVQSGQSIAGQGATDGATVKGVAGFNSAHFNVTGNGWVSSDIYSGGSNLGIVPSGGTSSKFLRGDGSFEVPAYVTYSAMNTATLGLGRLRYALGSTPAANSQSTTAGRTYGVTKNASDQLIVNVPWVDTNTQNVTSVSSSTDNDLLGIEVSPTTGAVKVGLDINGLTAISTLADADTLPIYDGGTNKKISILQLENHIGAAKSKKFILNTTTTDVSQQVSPPGGTIGWVVDLNASLGITDALNCMVEIIQTSNGRTVYAEVTRTGTGTSSKVTINFSTPVSQGAYQALITRIY